MGLFDDLIPAAQNAPPDAAPRPVREIPAPGRALLKAIAGSEAPGYDALYGGTRFESFADHPRQLVPITTGPNAGKKSSAAGLYQFLAPTWDEVRKEAGLTDFSPENQDYGAWHLAQKTYRGKTGRDLAQDLEAAKGNPNAVAGIGRMLSGIWTSLPGGIEPNRATSAFANRFENGAPRAAEPPVRVAAAAPATMTDAAPPHHAAGRRSLFEDLVPAATPATPASPAVAAAAPEAEPDTAGRFTDAAGPNFRTAREGESPTVATAGEGLKSGFFRGVTFNWIDELKALAEAGGMDPKDPDGGRALAALIQGAYKKFGGDPEAADAYRVALSRERADQERIAEQQPGAALAGELTGALAVPIGAAARAPTLGARTVQGLKTGAVVGALAGAGEGTDLTDRASRATTGAVVGSAIGAAAPAAVETVVRTGRGLVNAATPVTNTIRGLRDVDAEAGRRVVGAVERDIRAGDAGIVPAELVASRNAGGPAAIMDMGGEITRGLARSAGNTSPEGRGTLNRTINDRFETQGPRTAQLIDRMFGGVADTEAQRTALQEAARRTNAPAYARAHREPAAQAMWDEGFEQLMQAPVFQEAARNATRTSANRAAHEGFTPVRRPFEFHDADSLTPRYTLRTDDRGNRVLPNLGFWDSVKRNLDDKINSLQRAGENSAARDAQQLRSALVSHLDELVPSYQAARQGAARFFGAEDALDAGAQFVRLNANTTEARRNFARMNPAEQDMFRQGFASRFLDDLNRAPDRRSVLNWIGNAPAAREKLEMVLGPQRWREMEAHLRTEGVMDLARSAVQGNSTTARQLTELGLAGGAYGVGTGFDPFNPNTSALLGAALVYGTARGKGAIDERVARRVAEMLASNDMNVLRKGLNIVARNQNMMNSLRAFDASVARSGAEQAPTTGILPALQGPVAGRAEDDKPN